MLSEMHVVPYGSGCVVLEAGDEQLYANVSTLSKNEAEEPDDCYENASVPPAGGSSALLTPEAHAISVQERLLIRRREGGASSSPDVHHLVVSESDRVGEVGAPDQTVRAEQAVGPLHEAC